MTKTSPETDPTAKPRIALLGLGAMGSALARTWLAAGYPLTVWNRSPSRAEPLAAEGADVAATAAEAVASARLVVTCLLNDASVGEALEGADLSGRDLVDVTTGTPAEARARAEWARERGARFLSGGIMAGPPMVGVPEAGGYVLYSGGAEVFEEHRTALAVPVGARYVGGDAGLGPLQDVALLSAMNGMFAGMEHAFALVRNEDVSLKEFAKLLSDWLVAMAPVAAPDMAAQVETGDYTANTDSNLAMQIEGNRALMRTAREQGVGTELLALYGDLMERQLAGDAAPVAAGSR
ncbi:NAD(P)-dependent oxidoreductase [Nocardiopsis tropica]|uniref:NAD(P)-binding domain-containing protein n=1 Tax=Nocardiopsis tropica TaxID=109330 RepID=A0ABU7KXQ6_9ACTN|nr:NAD(P)-binding domain-containing protein [Nocardiopsis umidischolae]MEE2053774.1 NAD(P)-binding domain-containing protein [Nocardiopsis umidischolae]